LEHIDGAVPAAGNRGRVLGGFYFFLFMALGAVYPMLPLYLTEQGLSGKQFSTVMTMGTVVTVLFQPIWGMICDRWQAQKVLLVGTFLVAAGLSVFYPMAGSFALFLVLFTGMALFHSSGIPIVDSMALGYVQKHGGDYGSLRLWGAIGFAVASWLAGRVSEAIGLYVIFWIYSAAILVCVLLVRGLPMEGGSIKSDLRSGLRTLVRMPKFLLFLVATFLVFGTIQANNSFYGLFYTSIGGSVAGVGLSFLIAAGSEAPVMRVAQRFIARFGLVPILVAAGLISALRWVWYGFAPPPEWVTALLFVQGLSVGLYLPAAAQYVREIAPEEVRVTALGLYSAIGNGLGSMAGTLAGGFILDWLGIYSTYLFFGGAALVGVAAMILLRYVPDRLAERRG
jgi:PPP family 3-phenylpropionic acid transporter